MKFSTKASIAAVLTATFTLLGPSAYAVQPDMGRTWAKVMDNPNDPKDNDPNDGNAGCGNDVPKCKGPKGDPGPQGPQGPEGPAGPQGPKGDPGEDGEDGTDGTNGTDGEDGTDGTNGLTPVVTFTPKVDGCFTIVVTTGETVVTSPPICDGVGIAGPMGPQGPKGDVGEPGADGADGKSTSSTGARGPAGEDGKDGVTKTVYVERTVDTDGNVVTETPVDELPKTGGDEAWPYLLGIGSLLAVGGTLILRRKLHA